MEIFGIDNEPIDQSAKSFWTELFADSLSIELWEQFVDPIDCSGIGPLTLWLTVLSERHTLSVHLESNSESKRDNEWALRCALNLLRSMENNYGSKSMKTSLLSSMVLITKRLEGALECKSLRKSQLQKDSRNVPLYSVHAQISASFS